jgi:DNA polymerase-4
MTVRFETRSSGPGPTRTFRADDPAVTRANPVDSLDWPEFVDQLAGRDTA